MTVRCIDCGKFIPHADMERGLASFRHEPSSDRGVEVNEWTCAECVLENQQHYDEMLATVGVIAR